MGSWNGTCGVSNLPIISGDKVVMLPIAQDSFYDPDRPAQSACYNNSFWGVTGFPVRAEYNDYGWIENIQDNSFSEWNLEWIRENLIERNIGDNSSHDHAVKRDDISWERLGEIFHGDRLWLRSVSERNRRCGYFMLFRAELYDLLSTQTTFESYSKHSVSYRGDLATIIAQLEDDLAEAKKSPFSRDRPSLSKLSDEEIEALNEAASFDDYELRNKYRSLKELLKYRKTNPTNDKEFVDEFSRVVLFDIAVSSLRKHYTPMTGAGSQRTNWDTHRLLASEVLRISTAGWTAYEDE